jgi:hypothetical protein
MRVFLVTQVAKLIRKERLPEAALTRAAHEVLAGTFGPEKQILVEDCSKSASDGRVVARAAAIE